MPDWRHTPVLAKEVLEYLEPALRDGGRLIDGTLGNGGHSSLILDLNTTAVLLGIDRDGEALARARSNLAFAQDRIRLIQDTFGNLAAVAAEHGWRSANAVLLDIGVSSPQLDNAERGFSHRLDGPLDMRMDRRSPATASRILTFSPEGELVRIFRDYGEIREARRLARAIVARRETRPFTRTGELAGLCEELFRGGARRSHPLATLCFQALRIAVNDELGELERALPAAVELLVPGGRLAVISFHSLEDRIVKRFIRREAASCLCPPGLPECRCGHRPRLKELTRKPVQAGSEERHANRRAGSAKLRVAEKICNTNEKGQGV